jgi:hypothetical protein
MNPIVIGPELVSSTAWYWASSSIDSAENGNGVWGWVSRMVTETISMRTAGTPSADAGASEMRWTTSIPSETRPKIVYLPVSAG